MARLEPIAQPVPPPLAGPIHSLASFPLHLSGRTRSYPVESIAGHAALDAARNEVRRAGRPCVPGDVVVASAVLGGRGGVGLPRRPPSTRRNDERRRDRTMDSADL